MARITDLERRASVHAALAEPTRLAIVDELAVSDRSPTELAHRLDVPTNLLAHHLDVLESAGIVRRTASAGDGRRRYVQVDHDLARRFVDVPRRRQRPMVFLCTHNSARSQLAAALWAAHTGRPARSAGTRPAERVHRGAVDAARRHGIDLDTARPALVGTISRSAQVVTVCDLAHEELRPAADWWHWSIPDPVALGTAAAFDAVVDELTRRIGAITGHTFTNREDSR